ncbi:MAG: MiaB/RimO family radical SAM methylthiotransferase, partial [Candidatus Dadabacteria bacterium]|nr:MiaB/RimO family radical SAM methylthiotransferase [Candidatus Dadabacteria bacterium]
PVLLPDAYEDAPQGKPVLSIPGSSYLKVAEGCDNRCSYCSIPLIRGSLRSRPVTEITADASRLIESGVQEINLIAQDLGSYGKDGGGTDLIGLLKAILEIPGRYWIRMLYIHPDNFPLEVVDLCKSDQRVLPYFDIPLQHASKRILKDMGRKGDADVYKRLIRSIRDALPDAVMRTTFLLGYPGERRSDFSSLQEFQRDVGFDWLGAFCYSREKGTRAYSKGMFPGIAHRVRKTVVRHRLDRIITAQHDISSSRLSRFVGKTLDVLIEEAIQGEELFLGRIYAQAPEVDGLTVVHTGKAEAGRFIRCKITRVNGIDLEAVPV